MKIILKESQVETFLKRRFSLSDLQQIINDTKELIEYGTDPNTAVYDAAREFIKGKKFPDIDEFGDDRSYWNSYLKYERPIVDYVKSKLNLNESKIPINLKRIIGPSQLKKQK